MTKMLLFKLLFVSGNLMLVFVNAKQIPISEKNVDDTSQTNQYVIEPSNEWNSEVSTIVPPLIEGEPSPQVVVNEAPDANINTNPKDTQTIPDGPVNEYMNVPYSYPPTYYPAYPWTYLPQQYVPQSNVPSYVAAPSYMQQPNTPIYTTSPNMPTSQYAPGHVPATQYPIQADFEGVLVPFESLAPPPLQQTPLPQQKLQNNHSKENKFSPGRSDYDLAVILQALLPQNVLQTLVTWINFILNSFSMMALTAAIASAVCSLTPICQLTFGALPISVQRKFLGRMNNKDESELTTLQRVRRSIELYENLQQGVDAIEQSLIKTKKSH